MNKALQTATITALVGLASAGVLGLFRLSFAVTRLTVQVEELQKVVLKLEQNQRYLHGDVRP